MLERISRAWRAIKRFYTFILPVRFALLAILVVAFAFLGADQGRDALRALAEDRIGARWFRTLMLLVATNLLAYGLWYWSRHLLRYRPHALAPDDACLRKTDLVLAEFAGWTKWLPRVLGLLVFLLEIAGVLVATMVKSHVKTPVNLWIMVAWLAVSAIVFWIVVVKRRDLLGLPKQEMLDVAREWKDLGGATRKMLLLSLGIELLLFIWATVDPVSWWRIGVVAALVLTIAVWVPLGSLLVAVGEKWGVPILTLLLVWAFAISPIADNHEVRVLDKAPQRETLDAAFQRWETRMRALPQYSAPGSKIPVIVVATEGGGIRAAYWTAAVLTSLQDQIPSFADHCFAISGVSGGAVGASVFDALLIRRASTADNTPLHSHAREVLGFDALSGTLAAMSQPDLAQRFLPFGFPDRAQALEKGWEFGWQKRFPNEPNIFAQPFAATLQQNPNVPSLLLPGTLTETGGRVITSDIALHPHLYFRNAHDTLQKTGRDVRFSTASLLSARFTFVTPAGTLFDGATGEVAGHVVDGGYFEASGGVTATELVAFLREKPNVRPFVIYISYEESLQGRPPQNRARFLPGQGENGPGWPSETYSFANEVLSPLWAVFNAQSARGGQAVGDLKQVAKTDIVEFRLLPRFVPLPLGWVLSQRAQDSIDWSAACEGGNRTATEDIARSVGHPLPSSWQSATAQAARNQMLKYAKGTVPCG